MDIHALASKRARPDNASSEWSPEELLQRELGVVLLGASGQTLELPPLVDLAHAVIELSAGQRAKILLSLPTQPRELALSRHGAEIRASYYSTESIPDLFVWDRPLPLRELLTSTFNALRAQHSHTPHPLIERLLFRAEKLSVQPQTDEPVIVRRSSSAGKPASRPLAFSFSAQLPCPPTSEASASDRADIQALLFPGKLWGFARGRKILLANGPLFLAAQKMLVASRELVEAADAGRSVNLRLRYGTFGIGLRHARSGDVTVSLSAEHDTVTISSMNVRDAAQPIVSLMSDLIRVLVSVDRSQGRNLRIRTLREDIRRIRKALRRQSTVQGFLNLNPDRLREHRRSEEEATGRAGGRALISPPARRLRLTERWRFDVEELDARSTFLCGDRLVIASTRRAVSLDRTEGQVLWARATPPSRFWMTGQTLLRLEQNGHVELCSVEDGESFATTNIAPTLGRNPEAVHLSGNNIPPAALLTEGASRVVAIDLYTGQPRWRFKAPCGPIALTRSGRVLIIGSPDGCLSAVDATNGELVWRFRDPQLRFPIAPAIVGETVVVAAKRSDRPEHVVVGIDLYAGDQRWEAPLAGLATLPPLSLSISSGHVRAGIVTRSDEVTSRLLAIDPVSGSTLWETADPGLAQHGSAIMIDDQCIVNAPNGVVTSIDATTGQVTWKRHLPETPSADAPRRLEPVLRNGALFVPSGSVHILRPLDGETIGSPISADLIPDCLRVDERGWVYVAEESGLVSAYASGPQLTLIHGGAGPVVAIANA